MSRQAEQIDQRERLGLAELAGPGIGWFRGGVLLVAGVGVLLVAASYVQLRPKGGWVADRLTLGAEHTVGAWWSGSLLLVAGLLAVASGVALRSRAGELLKAGRTTAAYGMLGFWLSAMSLDELASLHERYHEAAIGISKALRLPPIALVMGMTLAWAFWSLWRERAALGWRWLACVVAGFGLMGKVYAFELVEHAVVWPAGWLPARLALEEGMELGGMGLVVLAVGWRWAAFCGDAQRASATLTAAAWMVGFGLLLVSPAMVVLQWATPPRDKWVEAAHCGLAVPAMLLLMGSAVAWVRAVALLHAGPTSTRTWAWGLASVLMLLGSLETMNALKRWFVSWPGDVMRPDVVAGVVGLGLVGLGAWIGRRRWWVVGVVVALLSVPGWVIYKTPVVQALAVVAAGLACWAMLADGAERKVGAGRR